MEAWQGVRTWWVTKHVPGAPMLCPGSDDREPPATEGRGGGSPPTPLSPFGGYVRAKPSLWHPGLCSSSSPRIQGCRPHGTGSLVPRGCVDEAGQKRRVQSGLSRGTVPCPSLEVKPRWSSWAGDPPLRAGGVSPSLSAEQKPAWSRQKRWTGPRGSTAVAPGTPVTSCLHPLPFLSCLTRGHQRPWPQTP